MKECIEELATSTTRSAERKEGTQDFKNENNVMRS
jgi:hypothetical protein